MKYFIGLLVVVGLIYGYKMYSKSGSYMKPLASVSPETMVRPETVMMEDGVVVVEMTGDKFRFSQPEIKVKVGDKVRVVLTAVDMPHDFDLEELSVDGPVTQPGETSEVEFTADKAGEYEYYCSVGQHRANGMVGKLVVE